MFIYCLILQITGEIDHFRDILYDLHITGAGLNMD